MKKMLLKKPKFDLKCAKALLYCKRRAAALTEASGGARQFAKRDWRKACKCPVLHHTYLPSASASRVLEPRGHVISFETAAASAFHSPWVYIDALVRPHQPCSF